MAEDQVRRGRERYKRVDLPDKSVAEFWLELRGEKEGHHTAFKPPQTTNDMTCGQ